MKLENLNETFELFKQIEGTGKENCVFFAYNDVAQISERGSLFKAVTNRVANELTFGISGIVSDMVSGSDDSIEVYREDLKLDVLNNYRHFLINETEDSISIIPMLFQGVLHWSTEGAQVFPESGRVIPKCIVEKIEINKFSFLTPTIRGIRIKLVDGYTLEFMGVTNFKTLPYHIENFKKFRNKYEKK